MPFENADLDLIFNVNANNKTVVATDISDYVDGGVLPEYVRGILKITNPAGVVLYNNTSYSIPTVNVGVSDESAPISIAASSDSLTGELVEGDYKFVYKSRMVFQNLPASFVDADGIKLSVEGVDLTPYFADGGTFSVLGAFGTNNNGTFTAFSVTYDEANNRTLVAKTGVPFGADASTNVRVSFVSDTQIFEREFVRCYKRVVVACDLNVFFDCNELFLQADDVTKYPANSVFSNYLLTVNPPVTSSNVPVAPPVSTDQKSITVAPLFTKSYSVVLFTNVVTTLPDGLLVSWVVKGTKSIDVVCKNNLVDAYDCINKLVERAKCEKCDCAEGSLSQLLLLVNAKYVLATIAQQAGNRKEVTRLCNEVFDLINSSGCGCTCTDPSSSSEPEPVQTSGMFFLNYGGDLASLIVNDQAAESAYNEIVSRLASLNTEVLETQALIVSYQNYYAFLDPFSSTFDDDYTAWRAEAQETAWGRVIAHNQALAQIVTLVSDFSVQFPTYASYIVGAQANLVATSEALQQMSVAVDTLFIQLDTVTSINFIATFFLIEQRFVDVEIAINAVSTELVSVNSAIGNLSATVVGLQNQMNSIAPLVDILTNAYIIRPRVFVDKHGLSGSSQYVESVPGFVFQTTFQTLCFDIVLFNTGVVNRDFVISNNSAQLGPEFVVPASGYLSLSVQISSRGNTFEHDFNINGYAFNSADGFQPVVFNAILPTGTMSNIVNSFTFNVTSSDVDVSRLFIESKTR
jgi:hypothetical protein